MSNIFKKALSEEKSLFANESALFPEYLPEQLPARESQVTELVSCLKPLLRGSRATNSLLYGGTGTGKTAVAKHVARELEDASSRVKAVYVNCFEFNSRFAVLSRIALELGVPIPRKGASTEEAYDSIIRVLPKSEKKILVVLDELDQLLKGEEGSKLLYDLLRLCEYDVSPIPFIAITNDVTLTIGLDARVRSSLLERQIEFKPYGPNELRGILKERASLAFGAGWKNIATEGALGLCVAYGLKNGGDARIAIDALWKASRIAEESGSGQGEEKHVRKAFESRMDHKAKRALDVLGYKDVELLEVVLQALAKKDKVYSGDLFALYGDKAKEPVAERTFRNYLARLATFNLISLQKTQKEDAGRTQEIRLTVPREEVAEMLKQRRH